MADQIPLRIVYVSGVPTIGEFQSGDTIASSITADVANLLLSVEGSTVNLSSYIAANEAMWSSDADVSTLSGLGDTTFTDLSTHQHIVYDGASWVNAYNDTTEMRVRNGNTVAMSKGDVIAIKDAHNANLVNVILADASQTSAMPALGILEQDLAVGEEGIAITFGKAQGLNTSGLTEGATAYVSPTTPGAVTETKPTDTDHLIQNIGIVMRAHASNGAIKVTGIGRANDIDNQTRADLRFLNGTTLMPAINSSFSAMPAWTEGTGSQGSEWVANPVSDDENIREYRPDPFNGSSIVWVARDTDGLGSYDGGIDASSVPIDASYTYRISGFVKQHTPTSGSNYFAFGPMHNFASDPTKTVVLTTNGAKETNPRFRNFHDLPTYDEWYLLVGHVQASSTTFPATKHENTGVWDLEGNLSQTSYNDFAFSSTATQMGLRFQQYNNPNGTGDEIEFFGPRIDKLDGNEPSIDDLLKLYTTQHGQLDGLDQNDHPQYVLSSTNSALSSLVTSIETSTVGLSSYIAANEGTWSGGGGVTDHGALTGLADDDHPQYLLSSTYATTSGVDETADYDFSSTEFHVHSGTVNINWSGTNGPTGASRRGKLNVRQDDTTKPAMTLYTAEDGADASPILEMKRDSSTAANNDYIGQIKWCANSDTGANRIYGKITGKIDEAANGAEGGLIEFMTRQGGSELIMARFKDNTFRTLNGVEIWSDGDIEISTSSVSGTMADVKTLEDKIQYVNTKTHLPQINSSYSGLTAWTEGSGAMTDWDIHPSMEASSNVRVFAPDPFNGSSIVWKAFDDGPHDTQAWEGGFFPTGSAQALDTSKPHRFSVFIKQHDNIIGSLYMGPHTTGSSAWAVVNQVTGAHNTNPYFEAGDNPAVDEWYLWVGFINASGTTTGSKNYDDLAGMYAMDGTRTNAGFDEYTFSSTATNQSLRAFYYSDSANDAQIGASFWAPRIDALDGNEPTIQDLLGLINTNHTEYARVDGTKDIQTQTLSDTYTGTVGDTSLGYGLETAGNLVNKAGNYLMFSSTNGYQFRKDGLTAYTSTDLPDAMRRWDDGYENTYRSLIQVSEAGGGQNISQASKQYFNFDTTDVSIGDASTDFTFNGSDTITINTTAVYEVTFNLAVEAGGTGTANQRTAQHVRLEKNGTDIGPEANTGYIRVTSSHLEASYHMGGHIMSLTATDTLKIGSVRASASTGVVNTLAGKCFWTIRRIG